MKAALHKKIFFACICSFITISVQAQYKLQGTIYDSSRTYPLDAVSVISTSGKGTTTNEFGFYQLEVSEKDSIWFSYLGKPTIKFPVSKIKDPSQFDLALQVPIDVLKEVRVRPTGHRQDSLQNRDDYAKIFNFRKPSLASMTSIGAHGAGIDINELIRTFQFKKNKATLRFQERLLQQERDKFIDYRFSKQLIHRLTGLADNELHEFALRYRPTYEFSLYSNDYDFHLYIKEAFQLYKRIKN